MTVMANSQNAAKYVLLQPSLHFFWHSFINPRNITSLNDFEAYLYVTDVEVRQEATIYQER